MQIIPSHLTFWPHLGCLTTPQARVLHVHAGSLGLFPQSLATLILSHSQRILHSHPSHGPYQSPELYKPWLLSNFWLRDLSSHIWNLCLESYRHLQKHVHTSAPCLPLRPAFLPLFSVSWSDTILLGIQARNNVVPYLPSPFSPSSATWIPYLVPRSVLPFPGLPLPKFCSSVFLVQAIAINS